MRGTIAALIAAIALGAAHAPAAASERWAFEPTSDGAAARSCETRGAAPSCAVAFCGADGALRFGVSGLAPDASGRPRSGRLRIDLRPLDVAWRYDAARGLWVAEGAEGAIAGLKRGFLVLAEFDGRDAPLTYTLVGSGDAIGALETRCAEVAAAPTAPTAGDGESDRWRVEDANAGVAATSCRVGGGREICAIAYCGADGALGFGLDGLDEERRAERGGRVVADDYDRVGRFTLADGPEPGDPLYSFETRDVAVLLDALSAGRTLDVFIERREAPLRFTLSGSAQAISALRRRCDALAASLARGPDGGLVQAWRFDAIGRAGVASACVALPRRDACAVAFCRADGVVHFGVDGLREGRAGVARDGQIETDRFREEVRFVLDDGPTPGDALWRARGVDGDRAARELLRGRDLLIDIAPRRDPILIPLRGSSRAVEAMLAHCAESASLAFAPTPRSSRWALDVFPNGAVASSCFEGRRGQICALAFCRADGPPRFGLSGGRPAPRGAERGGRLEAGDFARNVTWTRRRGIGGGPDIWVADPPQTRRLLRALRRENALFVEIDPRREPIGFGLEGSRAALRALQDRCGDAAREDAARADAPPPAVGRYLTEVVGRWGGGGLCRLGGWLFEPDRLSTPGGVTCRQVLVSERGDGRLEVLGRECFGEGARSEELTFLLERAPGGRLSIDVAGDGRGPVAHRLCR